MGKEIYDISTVPLVMSAKDLQALGFSRTCAYQFFNRSDFPTVQIGSRKYVRREKFFSWLDSQQVEATTENGRQL
ncbi:MAG: DNA-binding protein [Bacillota bacterium]|nr:DNA-binding protein [Bacillota bacterium]